MTNFMRIAQISGLSVDPALMIQFTDERLNEVDYSRLTRELFKERAEAAGRDLKR